MSWCPREFSREQCFLTLRSSGDDNETFPLEAVDEWISKLSRMSRKSCWRGASNRATMITVGFQLPWNVMKRRLCLLTVLLLLELTLVISCLFNSSFMLFGF